MQFYALYKNEKLVGITNEIPFTGTPKLKDIKINDQPVDYNRVVDHWDFDKFSDAQMQELADFATKQYGKLVVATKTGAGDRDLCIVPSVGDEVSYAFNGDYTPCGKVARLTPSLTVITDTGKRFRRRQESGSWVMEGGTWSLVPGHHYERNPQF